jgi:hypothetical protein
MTLSLYWKYALISLMPKMYSLDLNCGSRSGVLFQRCHCQKKFKVNFIHGYRCVECLQLSDISEHLQTLHNSLCLTRDHRPICSTFIFLFQTSQNLPKVYCGYRQTERFVSTLHVPTRAYYVRRSRLIDDFAKQSSEQAFTIWRLK